MASYQRAVAMAALQAALSSAWIAAQELTPARRRLARAGAVAAVSAVAYVVTPSSPASSSSPPPSSSPSSPPSPLSPSSPPSASSDPSPDAPFDKRKAVLTVGVLGLSVAALVGRRRLEKKWLARLTRNGHPHPTRSLAVRMAGVEFAAQLAIQLADLHKPDGPKRPESEADRDRPGA